jgi:NAD(P)-dependent dehydrogenase (short-subunit alcohol dehydrogenase family)
MNQKSEPIAVIGAAGHTGKFVVAELVRRAIPVIAIGRNEADLDDPASLDRALKDACAVINVAGPFLDTAQQVIEAALRARIHYFDVTAEQASALSTFDRYDEAARSRGIVVIPAAGFYRGLGDLLATAALADWTSADEVTISIALDRWWPTEGTRKTGRRNTVPRVVLSSGKLEQQRMPARTETHAFPEPFGMQKVVEVPLSETILIARHIATSDMHNFINEAPLNDLGNPMTPPPAPSDDQGRSAQVFLIEAVVRRSHDSRRLVARGRDIYACTAPLVVEAAELLVGGNSAARGCFTLGQIFDATDFLKSLAPDLALTDPEELIGLER